MHWIFFPVLSELVFPLMAFIILFLFPSSGGSFVNFDRYFSSQWMCFFYLTSCLCFTMCLFTFLVVAFSEKLCHWRQLWWMQPCQLPPNKEVQKLEKDGFSSILSKASKWQKVSSSQLKQVSLVSVSYIFNKNLLNNLNFGDALFNQISKYLSFTAVCQSYLVCH